MFFPIKFFTYHLFSFKAPCFDGECVTSKRTLLKLERFIVPLSLLHLMIFGFLTYQSIDLFSTSDTKIFLFLPSNLLLLLQLVGKISIVFFPKKTFFFLLLLKIFITIFTKRFFPLEHHFTLLQRLSCFRVSLSLFTDHFYRSHHHHQICSFIFLLPRPNFSQNS